MFERFTDRGRRVLVLAQDEARGRGLDYLGTEHILAGLVLEESGVAGRVLAEAGITIDGVRDGVERLIPGGGFGAAEALATIGIDLEVVRQKVEESFGEGALQLPEPPPPAFTPKGKRVLELAFEASGELMHSYIGTEHILLGLLALADGVAFRILGDHIPADELRQRVIAMLETYHVPDDRPALASESVELKGMFAAHLGYLAPIREAFLVGSAVLVDIRASDETRSACVNLLSGLAIGLDGDLVNLAPGIYLLKNKATRLSPDTRLELLGLIESTT